MTLAELIIQTDQEEKPGFTVDVLEDKSIEVVYTIGNTDQFDGIDVADYNLGSFKSLPALFYALLYDNTFKEVISEQKRKEISRIIEMVYFNSYLPPNESLAVMQSYLDRGVPSLNFEVCRKHDNIRNALVDEWIEKFSEDKPFPDFKSCEGMMEACKYWHLHVPVKTYLEFETGDDLISWALQTLIDSGKSFNICRACLRYFVPARTKTAYCSQECRNKLQAEDRSCGCSEAERRYQKILRAIARRRDSGLIYEYFPPSFSGEFNQFELFRDYKFKNEEQLCQYRFQSKDFDVIRKDFMRLKQKHYKEFRRTFQESKKERKPEGESERESKQEFERSKEAYITWLDNINAQIHGLKKV
jgi:hypothetical protein